jgi:2-polyprenyl-3-methyl-5-hydroxy-6-metoxy-1,4-benzoquinol methylase
MLRNLLSEDFYRWFRARSAPLPENINVHIDASKTFIDIGAGNGFFLSTVTGAKKRDAVEVWDKRIAYLREHFPDSTVYTSIFDVPEPYDVVACMDVLHHIEDNAERDKFLVTLFRIVKPGGTLIIKDMRDDLLLHKYANRLSDYLSTRSHPNEMNPERLIDLLKTAGFEIARFEKYTALVYAHYYLVAKKSL